MNDYYAHSTATLDEGCVIGEGTRIWHHAHIMPDVVIGKDCNIGENVYVENGVRVGDQVKIKNNVAVYDGVVLEDGVFCGPSCVFTNDLTPRSRFPKSEQDRIKTIVREGATIGANATIVCGCEIGTNAMIGAGSVVTSNVSPHALVYGNPATAHGWVCECGSKLTDDLTCPQCNRRYMPDNGGFSIIDKGTVS